MYLILLRWVSNHAPAWGFDSKEKGEAAIHQDFVKRKREGRFAIYTAYSAWVSTISLCPVFPTRQSSRALKYPTVSSFFQIFATRFPLSFHGFFRLSFFLNLNWESFCTDSFFKIDWRAKGNFFRKLRTKISVSSSATVTFSSTFASFCLNRLIFICSKSEHLPIL